MSITKFKPFSNKQKKILTWWFEQSGVSNSNGIIADGAIRSGKTLSMALSYVFWAMETFDDQNFGMCGKTITSFRRNVTTWLKSALTGRGYSVKDNRTENVMKVSRNGVTNSFYIFGGKDERSQDLIQGITLAGVFFDEVALMPKSFVEQATGRCSVAGSKYWFNCNPAGALHWFKTEWIDKQDEKQLLYLHFDMDDNLSLTEEIKQRYHRQYSGVFFDRYIKGLWVAAENAIYNMFDAKTMIVDTLPNMQRYWIGVDYGHTNATVFLLLGEGFDNKLYVISEYYHSGGESSSKKSPSAYARDFIQWAKESLGNNAARLQAIYIDPAANGFREQMKEYGVQQMRQTDNRVNDGIILTQSIIDSELLYVHCSCKKLLDEIPNYTWDDKAVDKPIKQHDHALDALRYAVMGERRYWERRVANAT